MSLKVFNLFLCMSILTALTACDKSDNGSSQNNGSSSNIEGVYSMTSLAQPKAFQEIGQFYSNSSQTLGNILMKATDTGLTLFLPGGGYRTVQYTIDMKSRKIKFSAPILYVSDYFNENGEKDVTECSFVFETFTYKNMTDKSLQLYRTGADPGHINSKNGEWSLSFKSLDKYSLPESAIAVDGEYGTSFKPVDLGLASGAVWSAKCVDGNRLFTFNDKGDMASAWFGPKYQLPSRTHAEELVSKVHFMALETTSGPIVSIVTNDLNKRIDLPYPGTVPGEIGFWLSDGSALVLTLNSKTDAELGAEIVENPEKQYMVLPVMK